MCLGPVGTGVGVYQVWVLFSRKAREGKAKHEGHEEA